MNRIKISPLATDAPCDSRHPPSISTRQNPIPTSQAAANEFFVFVPLHYEKNHAYPLIVWLHSDRQSADQLQSVMLDMSLRNYVGIAPQGPLENSQSGQAGFGWDQDWDTIDQAQESVLEAIEHAQLRFNVHPNRIFLAGCGSGGTMAFRLAFNHPEIFAGVMSINGPLPEGQSPLRGWSNCRELPVFWAHARQSMEFDQDQLCHQLRLLHIAGFSVTLRQYPQSDLLCQKTLADMNRWIMEMNNAAIL